MSPARTHTLSHAFSIQKFSVFNATKKTIRLTDLQIMESVIHCAVIHFDAVRISGTCLSTIHVLVQNLRRILTITTLKYVCISHEDQRVLSS